MRTEGRWRAAALASMLGVAAWGVSASAHAEAPADTTTTDTSTSPAPPPDEATAEPGPRGPARWYQTPLHDRRRFSVAGHVEGQVVGIAFGLRAEALYRPFRPDRGANLRLGVGLQGGPEYAYLPFDIGWRQHFVPHRIFALELGAGYELQSFVVPDLGTVSRSAFYGEGGFAFQVTPGGWLGAQIVTGWAPFSTPGPSIAARVGFRWNFGARADARQRS